MAALSTHRTGPTIVINGVTASRKPPLAEDELYETELYEGKRRQQKQLISDDLREADRNLF
jgi:hypothetical protein